MEDLPSDVLSKILSYVPRESVLDCKLVSKTWETLLSHRKPAGGLLLSTDKLWGTDVQLRFGYFGDILSVIQAKDEDKCFYKKLAKIKHPLANKDKFITSNLIGSCNGLVCLLIHQYDAQHEYDHAVFNVYVFNPLTGECSNLPTIDDQISRIVFGFGYNPSGRNYKVVRIQYHHTNKKRSVQVYTLGGDSSGWRSIGETKYSLVSGGTYWNGSIHWLDRKKWKIVAFDLADEKFRCLATTPSFEHIGDTQLTLLGGYLSIVSMERGNKRTIIWSLKNKQNHDATAEDGYYPSWDWTLEFSIPFFPNGANYLPFVSDDEDDDELALAYFFFEDEVDYDNAGYARYEPFGLTRNNEVFLWYKTDGMNTNQFLCRYDPKTDSLIKVLDGGVTAFDGIPHVNSLVSLKSLGVLDSKTTKVVADCA